MLLNGYISDQEIIKVAYIKFLTHERPIDIIFVEVYTTQALIQLLTFPPLIKVVGLKCEVFFKVSEIHPRAIKSGS